MLFKVNINTMKNLLRVHRTSERPEKNVDFAVTDETCREQQNTLSHTTTTIWRARRIVPKTLARKCSQNREVPWIIVGDSDCRFIATTIESTFSLDLTRWRHQRWAVFEGERERGRKRGGGGKGGRGGGNIPMELRALGREYERSAIRTFVSRSFSTCTYSPSRFHIKYRNLTAVLKTQTELHMYRY